MELTRNKAQDLFFQLSKFGIVGAIATALHIGLFTMFVETGMASPLIANLLAFVPSFLVSFYSHFIWTFKCSSEYGRKYVLWTMAKFLSAALLGIGLNSLWVYLVTDYFMIEYYYSILCFVFITPAVSFVVNKVFVFKKLQQ